MMPGPITRRSALGTIGALSALALGGCATRSILGEREPGSSGSTQGSAPPGRDSLRVSLAQWSLHRMIRRGELAPMDFPAFAKATFGISGVEYVNQFYQSMPRELTWARELRGRAADAGVTSVLIMCDGEGSLGAAEPSVRSQSIERHKFWLEAAATLGCQSIRVNAHSEGAPDGQMALCADGIGRLCDLAAPMNLKVLVENHGGLSCDGGWVATLIRSTGRANCGSLPDFGNFTCSDGTTFDRYIGVREMLPYAGGVSAKSHGFTAAGEERAIDYARMLSLVRAAGYHGWIGAEFEGDELPEIEGTRATVDLLRRNGCTL